MSYEYVHEVGDGKREKQKKEAKHEQNESLRGNEACSEVKSKVEAHLLQSDDSKTNEAQRGTLKKADCSFIAYWKLAH